MNIENLEKVKEFLNIVGRYQKESDLNRIDAMFIVNDVKGCIKFFGLEPVLDGYTLDTLANPLVVEAIKAKVARDTIITEVIDGLADDFVCFGRRNASKWGEEICSKYNKSLGFCKESAKSGEQSLQVIDVTDNGKVQIIWFDKDCMATNIYGNSEEYVAVLFELPYVPSTKDLLIGQLSRPMQMLYMMGLDKGK